MSEGIFPDVLLRPSDLVFPWQLEQQCRSRTCSADSLRQCPRQRIKQWIRIRPSCLQLHVIMVLNKIQNPFAAVSFDPDRHELVLGGPLCRIDTKRVFAFAHFVDIRSHFRAAALEVPMQQYAKVVQKIDVCPAVDVLV